MRATRRTRAVVLSIAAALALTCATEARPQRANEAALPLGGARMETPERAGVRPSGGGIDAGLATTIGSLIIVIALIAGTAAAVRRVAARSGGLMGAAGAGGRSPAGVLEVLGRYPIGRGSTLLLLKLDRRVLLIGSCAGGRAGATLGTLCEISDPEEVASLLIKTRDAEDESMSRRFQTLLAGQEHEAARALDLNPRPDRTGKATAAAVAPRRVLKDIAA